METTGVVTIWDNIQTEEEEVREAEDVTIIVVKRSMDGQE